MTNHREVEDKQSATNTQTSEPSAWTHNIITETWGDMKNYAKRDFPNDRWGAAGVAAEVGLIAVPVTIVAGTIGAIAYPIHKVGGWLGFDTKDRLEQDKGLLKTAGEGLVTAPVAEAYAAYTLIVPPKKQ